MQRSDSRFVISDKAHVLALDDQPVNLQTLTELLSQDYYVHPFIEPGALFKYIADGKPADVILLDIVMPGEDGFSVCEKLRKLPEIEDVPIVFLTGLDSKYDEERGLLLGAADYITKPVMPGIVRSRVRNQANLSRAMRIIQEQNKLLDMRVAQRTADLARKNTELILRTDEIIRTQEATMLALSSLAETRDSDTGRHIFRTQTFVRELAEAMRRRGKYLDVLTSELISELYRSAALHDIGKVAIPDHVLLKPGKLTAEEFEVMKTHAQLGSHAIEMAEQVLGSTSSFLSTARDIAHYHHERWDGKGYPDGRAGDDIPLSARIMAVADVYDALTCERVYKKGMPHQQATQILVEGRGAHFDPDVLDTFVEIEQRFAEIAHEFADQPG